jgi:uncharacterized membrane protein YdbT with pleckstrin-like domain
VSAYVERTLMPGEQVVYTGRIHWWCYVPYVLVTLLSFGLLFPLLLVPIFRQFSTEMVVTNRRVIMKKGLISRRTVELNLAKVETVSVDQGLVGRILDLGTLGVVGTGGTVEQFAYVDNPLGFRRAVTERAEVV